MGFPSAASLPALIWLAAVSSFAAEVENLDTLLAKHLRNNRDLPSIAAVVITRGEFSAQGVAGVRKSGDPTKVTIQDKYHIGSCTKAFTGTLAATLVETGVLKWESAIGEVLPDLKPESRISGTTLRQLVTNTGGFPEHVPSEIWSAAWKATGKPKQQRQTFVRSMLQESASVPGSRYEYSNTGFAIAGTMMEEATGKSWEDLIREKIFTPLDMKSAGFYSPAKAARVPDQPWGHQNDGKPVKPGPGSDNPPAIAPAGAIHCSLPDLVPWMKMHMNREIGPVLKNESIYQTLHTPVRKDYAMGWVSLSRPWAGGKALHHMGSNTMFTTVIWIAPEKKFAVAVATNIGHEVGFVPCDELIGTLIQTFLP